MKKIAIGVYALLVTMASFTTVKAQTADDVIKKHLEAIGGEANWKKINSVIINGTISANGAELKVKQTVLHNKGMRLDLDFGGMSNYQIVTTSEGWAYFPIGGQKKPEAMTADQVKSQQDELDVQGELVDYKTKGNKLEYLGKEDFEGVDCYKIKMTTKEGKEETMFFDASNYYMIRSVSKIKADGQEQEEATTFSNYQKLPEGIVFPMDIETSNGPLKLTSVEINKPIDENIFKPTS